MQYPEYEKWVEDPTPENLSEVVKAVDPVIVSEVQRYTGPKDILRIKAKEYAIKAVETYDPAQGASLRTWVTTQLKPLSRYGQRLYSVRVPEVVRRQAAELNTQAEKLHDELGRVPEDKELADYTGLSVGRINNLRDRVRASVTESEMTAPRDGVPGEMPAVQMPSGNTYSFEAVYQDLDPREKVIVDWKTGSHGKEQLSNQEIARRLGVSPAFVTQLTARITDRIKEVASYGV